MLKWLKEITLSTQGKYWDSISDFPLYNWIKCNNDQYQYVRINPVGKPTENDVKQWVKLYDEYLKEFGLNEKYVKFLEAQTKRALLQAEYVISKNEFKKTEIEIQNAKMKSLEVYFGDGKDIEVILLWLSKFLGYKINTKETSVKEYFLMLEEYGKANKKVRDSRTGSI